VSDITLPARITILSSPRPFEFEVKHGALLAIDMQRDFCSAGGYMDHAGVDLAALRKPIDRIRDIVNETRRIGMCIIYTREGHRPGLETLPATFLERTQFVGHTVGKSGPLGRLLVRGEYGHGIIDELEPRDGELIIDKPGKSSFYATDLETILRQRRITHLLFTGLTTNCCVESTVREASDRGFSNLIISDGTGAATERMHTYAIEAMTCLGGIFAVSAETQRVLAGFKSMPTAAEGRQ
jgi:nicotinamidase-related amidase